MGEGRNKQVFIGGSIPFFKPLFDIALKSMDPEFYYSWVLFLLLHQVIIKFNPLDNFLINVHVKLQLLSVSGIQRLLPTISQHELVNYIGAVSAGLVYNCEVRTLDLRRIRVCSV